MHARVLLLLHFKCYLGVKCTIKLGSVHYWTITDSYYYYCYHNHHHHYYFCIFDSRLLL